MTNPTPRKPSKVTVEVHGHIIDILVDIEEPNTTPSPEVKAFIERRKQERRERTERAAREQGTNPTGNERPTDTPAT